jgi:hypothetical protein
MELPTLTLDIKTLMKFPDWQYFMDIITYHCQEELAQSVSP